jgi:hypothetical protein
MAGVAVSVLPLRQSAVAGSKKQSFITPTKSVLATWASIAQTRAGSAMFPPAWAETRHPDSSGIICGAR